MAKQHKPAVSFDDNAEHEERKGLLGLDPEQPRQSEYDDDNETPKAWSKRKVAVAGAGVILLLIGGAFARILLMKPPRFEIGGDEIRSNGTHDFKRTVLMVSIDGLRADYLDRGFTPHLLDISKKGLRAKSMKPIFPTLTFPNHWALMTGLHTESHGIIANNFWDPVSQLEFHYNRIDSAWTPDWWQGEPIWETAERADIVTANLMWPGPPKTTSGASSTFFVPWKDKVPMQDKLEQLMNWIDLPFEKRPQLLLAYEPSLDQAGHATGPNSSRTNQTLTEVDLFAKGLHDSLAARNLSDIVDIVFVSDHGMTDTSHPELVYLDDIIGLDGFSLIAHEDGWPCMGLRFSPQANVTHYLNLLLDAADANPEKFDVYTKETMPERYHFVNNERIAPIYVVPKIGYALTSRKEGDVGMTKGNHGYDNDELSMHAMFVAHGPFSSVVKTAQKNWARTLSGAQARGWHSTDDDTYVMERFPNVEIYGLIVRLLGMEQYAAPTNGTKDFWDKFF